MATNPVAEVDRELRRLSAQLSDAERRGRRWAIPGIEQDIDQLLARRAELWAQDADSLQPLVD